MTHSPRTAALLLAALLGAGCASNEPEGPEPEQLLSMHKELALRYYDLDDLQRAEDQVRRGLDLDPDDVTLRLMLGWIRHRRGKADDLRVAENVFRSLLDENDYRAWLGLGGVLERKGLLYIESADEIESGQRTTDRPDPKARAEELRRDGAAAWKEAVAAYEKTLELKPDDVQAINGLQRTWALASKLPTMSPPQQRAAAESSLQWARKLLDITGAELDFWNQQLERPDLTASEEQRLRSLVTSATNLQVATLLTSEGLCRQLGRWDDALAAIDALVERRPDLPMGHSLRAQVLHRLGREREAIESLDTFLRLSQLDFDHPDIRRAYALRSACELALRQQEP